MTLNRAVDVLRRLFHGEVLEYQSQKYFLRGVPVQARLAQGLVRKGFIELPPTLFAPAGGRLTASWRLCVERDTLRFNAKTPGRKGAKGLLG